MSVSYYPLDFDALNKGDTLTVEQLEGITGQRRGTQQYELDVLGLKVRIARELRDRGKPATVATIKGCLRILTSEEALEYDPGQYRLAFRKMVRAHRRCLSNINPAELTDVQQRTLERRILVQGKMLQAARGARRQLAATAHRRTTPGLPTPQPPAAELPPAERSC